MLYLHLLASCSSVSRHFTSLFLYSSFFPSSFSRLSFKSRSSIFSPPVSPTSLLLSAFNVPFSFLFFHSRSLGHLFALLFVQSFLCCFICSARFLSPLPLTHCRRINLMIETVEQIQVAGANERKVQRNKHPTFDISYFVIS